MRQTRKYENTKVATPCLRRQYAPKMPYAVIRGNRPRTATGQLAAGRYIKTKVTTLCLLHQRSPKMHHTAGHRNCQRAVAPYTTDHTVPAAPLNPENAPQEGQAGQFIGSRRLIHMSGWAMLVAPFKPAAGRAVHTRQVRNKQGGPQRTCGADKPPKYTKGAGCK